ncbi:GPW/gp25 family protein [Acidaminococcus timonensis]|uniref:GPW/gp25 family protein n=1 Tax=Acidaminococcus timonensis TaxID=1871002 RepID=UPI00307E7479
MGKNLIVMANGQDIDFAPATVEEEIIQNVRTILTTYQRTVPLDRGFGISAEYLDKTLPVAQATMASELMTAIRQYEPRCQVVGITFTGDDNGALRPRIEVTINDNAL